VDRLVREEGIPLADISERFSADRDPTTLILGVGDTHPSPRAQQLIATVIEAELERLGWLE
jgi:lysophospholipase L1-like esterase